MEPIVLIHGYSAESRGLTLEAITGIYGTLPQALKEAYGQQAVLEINLSRYVSLEDGLSVDDISRALDRVLRSEFAGLLGRRFHVLAHSTGALVVRNWIRRFGPKPSPIQNLVYLAGASFGSGWAHIGKGQLAKWARSVFQGGSERGVQVLDALELGASWTIDLHRHFLAPGNDMHLDYGVQEYVLVGTQADVGWFSIPIRYAKEDGSDGVVRVAASNVGFNYLALGPTQEARQLSWQEAKEEQKKDRRRAQDRRQLYEVHQHVRPGVEGRSVIPLAIPFRCAHSGKDMGIVTGSQPREQALQLLRGALETRPGDWQARVADFAAATAQTYEQARVQKVPAAWKKWIQSPQAQYDAHAQVVLRIRDQDGRPIEHFDIFFDSLQAGGTQALPLGRLIEDKHTNSNTPNVILFYLRTKAWDAGRGDWIARVPQVQGCYLEVTAIEPETEEIVYVPMRFEFSAEVLTQWIVDHRTTVIDVELLRIPAPGIYRMLLF